MCVAAFVVAEFEYDDFNNSMVYCRVEILATLTILHHQ